MWYINLVNLCDRLQVHPIFGWVIGILLTILFHNLAKLFTYHLGHIASCDRMKTFCFYTISVENNKRRIPSNKFAIGVSFSQTSLAHIHIQVRSYIHTHTHTRTYPYIVYNCTYTCSIHIATVCMAQVQHAFHCSRLAFMYLMSSTNPSVFMHVSDIHIYHRVFNVISLCSCLMLVYVSYFQTYVRISITYLLF